ncbi:MAG: sulfatase family protein, partial [Candidatus Binatia bacterium]
DHGNALYEHQVHVPLVIRFPARVPAGRVVSTPVTTLDVFSTLLDLVAVPAPPAIQSQSLLPLLSGGASADDRTLVAELRRSENWSTLSRVFDRELLALRRGPWKYIVSSTGSTELYHIPEDPAEGDNRVQREPEVARSLHREALRWMRRAGSGQQRSIDQATREQLKSLGY